MMVLERRNEEPEAEMLKQRDPQWLARIGREHAELRTRGVRYGHATGYLCAREGVSAVAVLTAVRLVQGRLP